MIEMYYNDVSSIVNDGIGEVLYLLKKRSHKHKKHKKQLSSWMLLSCKKHKALNKRILFILDVFMHTKSIKSIKR